MLKRLASHGIVDARMELGITSSIDSNHLSTSSSAAKQPHVRSKAISVIISMVKKDALRARSKGFKSAPKVMYLSLMRAMNWTKCLLTNASSPLISLPAY